MLGVSIAAVVMELPVETIGTRFGGVPSGLPDLQFPSIQWAVLPDLLVPAMTVAMLGAIESLLSATVADRMTGTRHNPNVELIGAGRCQSLLAAGRRPAGDGRDRANGHEHPLGREDAGGWNDSRGRRCC